MTRLRTMPCTLICGRTTLSRLTCRRRARFAASPLLPRDEAGPVFAEPWQAQAFALAVQLSAAGHFTWTEWTTALGDQLQRRRIAAHRMMARATSNTGWRRSNSW